MASRTVKNEYERSLLIRYIEAHKLPFTANVTKGGRRSVEQNKLQRLWLNEIAEQLGDRTPEEVRGDAKLRFGVPILRAENEDFCEKYDRLIKPRSYEEKLELMMEPMDFPITRLMSTDQKTRYLDAMCQHYLEQGMALTDPDPMRSRAA